MTLKDFKKDIKKYDVDIFIFCLFNELDSSIIDSIKDECELPVLFLDKWNSYKNENSIDETLYTFYDACECQGLNIKDDKVQIELDSKKQNFSFTINHNLLKYINFY